MPTVSLPEIRLSDVRVGDRRLRDVKLSDLDLRDRMHRIDVPDLHDVRASGLDAAAAMGELAHRRPEFDLHDLRRAGSDAIRPAMDRIANVDGATVRHVANDVRDAAFAARTSALALAGRRERRRGPGLLPWVVLVAAGTAFGSWWLWTSSMTGPRVRAAVGGLRRRVDGMRGTTDGWDDADGSSDTWGVAATAPDGSSAEPIADAGEVAGSPQEDSAD